MIRADSTNKLYFLIERIYENYISASGISETSYKQQLLVWRKRILNIIFTVNVILGTLSITPNAIFCIKNHYYQPLISAVMLYVISIIILVFQKIPFKVRAVAAASIFYLFGLNLVLTGGPITGAFHWLSFSSILGILLLGARFGFSILILNVVSLSGIIYLYQHHMLEWTSYRHYPIDLMINNVLNFTVINFMINLALLILLKSLAQVLIKNQNSQSVTIHGLAKLAEYRDLDTGSHLDRIREYTRILTSGLLSISKYSNYITDEYIESICISSMLHDIGKVGITDQILLKPGKLTFEEFEEMKKHTIIGGDAISRIESRISGKSFLSIGKQIAYYHHEKWDGSGYPEKLAGDNIPISARIVALADVYDALVSRRVYKPPFTHSQAKDIIMSEKGTHFDPDIVDIFFKNQDDFLMIKNSFSKV